MILIVSRHVGGVSGYHATWELGFFNNVQILLLLVLGADSLDR